MLLHSLKRQHASQLTDNKKLQHKSNQTMNTTAREQRQGM